MNLPESATLIVSELHCHEDGCPDVETVIAVMVPGTERQTWKLGKAMAEIDVGDVADLTHH